MRLLVPSLSLLLLAPAAVTAGTPKVDVCHVTGSATNPVSLLSVSSSAVATHLAHGDYAPYTVYADMDLDGFGDAGDSFGSNCLTPEGYVEDDTDCDDTNPDVNPAAGETDYNGVDDDCDAGTPDDDLDGDGYDLAEDRDDLDDAVNPGVVESEYSGVDHDCDASTPDDDLDGDGYELANDCDDSDPDVSPAAAETVCNGVNDDCDAGTPDDELDRDGYDHATDCDDLDAAVNPGAAEIEDNGVDHYCDGGTADQARPGTRPRTTTAATRPALGATA